jgi:BirA family biotin operon repressor/biotin-[acetyl-CoA-carboxylase] ligase
MVVSTAGRIDARSLLALLADGRLHSGEELAGTLGVSRAAIWKGVDRLRQRGIEVQAQPRRGYCLPRPVELYDAQRLRAAVAPGRAARLSHLDVLFEVDSTNTRLLAAPPPPEDSANATVSEIQSGGRGRRGRRWIAPFGASIALSLGWAFRDAAHVTPALSLCVGVAVARALRRAGAQRIALKWPNDIWFEDRKLGGILLELRAEASGPAYVVIGVGINVELTPAQRSELAALGVRAAAVSDACVAPPSRNFIAGAIIDELLSMLAHFERDGFAPLKDAWEALDALRDRPAQVLMEGSALAGIARGVDDSGALCLERKGRMQKFVSGEVSLRLAGDVM